MNIERNEAFYDKKPSFSDKNSPFDSKKFTSKDHGNEAKSYQSYNNESFSENQLKNYSDSYRNITKESEYFEKYPSITKQDHHSGQIRNMNKKQMNHPARGGVNNAHKLNGVQQKAVSLRKSKGQVFDIEAHSHDFDQIKKSFVDIQMLNHPVYEIDGEHKFNEIPKNLFDSKISMPLLFLSNFGLLKYFCFYRISSWDFLARVKVLIPRSR